MMNRLLSACVLAGSFFFFSGLKSQNLYTSGLKTWSQTGTNWSAAPGGPYNIAWANMSNAYFQDSAGITTLSGFEPRLAGIYALLDFTLTSNASERVYLSGTASPYIDVAAGKTFTLSSLLSGGLGFTKRSDGTLVLGHYNNRFWGTVSLGAGTIGFSDISNRPARSALRCNPVTLSSGTSIRYTGSNASNISLGSISGSGDIDAGSNGIVSFLLMASASTDVSMSTGANGFSLYGYNSAYTQTLSGDLRSVSGQISVYGTRKSSSSSSANLKLWNNTTSGGAATDGNISAYLQGGRLLLDNTNSNTGSGSSTDRFCNTCSMTFAGGLLEMKGSSAGSIEDIKNINLSTGASSIKIEHNGGSGGTELTSTSTALFASNSVINFLSSGGTMGQSGSNPRITFAGALPTNTTNGMLAQSSGAGVATIGWAVVNSNKWAGVNGSYSIIESGETSRSTSDISSVAAWEITSYAPSGITTLSSGISPGALKITASPAGYWLLNNGGITTTAVMLDGSNNFLLSGSGNISNGTNPRYFWVNNSAAALSVANNLSDQNADIIKAGSGTLSLRSNPDQLKFTSNTNVTVLDGTLRATAKSLNGATSAGGAYTTINLFGGVLELDSGVTFTRAIGLNGTSAGGGIFMNSGTGGGFAAINGNADVNLVTTVGGSTLATLQWGTSNFLPDGAPLRLNSPTSNSQLTFNNDIALDNGTAGAYKVREIFVDDNPSSSSDYVRFLGHISGSSTTDLIKTGPGELRWYFGNTFTGNFILAEGSIRFINSGIFPITINVIVLSGATIYMDAGMYIHDLILEPGANIISAGYGPTLNGNFVNNGANFTINGGSWLWTWGSTTGTSRNYIDGQAVDFTIKGSFFINNYAGVGLNSDISIANLGYNGITANLYIGSHTMTITNYSGGASTRISCNGSSNLIINGTGAMTSNLYFDQTTPGITNRLNNFTFNRTSSGSATLGSALQVAGTLTVSNGTFTTGGNLTLISNSSGTANVAEMGGSVSGNVTAQRYIPAITYGSQLNARRYRFMGVPVNVGSGNTSCRLSMFTSDIDITGSGGSTNGFTTTTTNSPSAFLYNEAYGISSDLNEGWFSPATTGTDITQGRGIRMLIRGTKNQGLDFNSTQPSTYYTPNPVTINFSGNLNQGTISLPVSYAANNSGALDGWCLVANPYASILDWNLVKAQTSSDFASIDDAIYMWDPSGTNTTKGGYASYVNGVGGGSNVQGTRYIGPGIAFFVKASAANPVLNVKEAHKASTLPPNFLGKTGVEKPNALRIELLLNDTLRDNAVLYFEDGASRNFSGKHDAWKLNYGIGFIKQDQTLSCISGNPFPAGFESYPMILDKLNNGSYKLRFTGLGSFAVSPAFYLEDKFTGKSWPVCDLCSYSFSVDSSDKKSYGNERFRITYGKASTGFNDADADLPSFDFTVYPLPAGETISLQIKDQTSAPLVIDIYNLSGQLLQSGELHSGENTIDIHNLNPGFYLIKAGKRTRKFVVER